MTTSGCYWGTEKFFKKDFGVKVFKGVGKVLDGKVGFMGMLHLLSLSQFVVYSVDSLGPPSAKPNPTYREVGQIHYSDYPFFNFSAL